MTRIDKLINRFLENPKSLKFKKIEKVLLYLNFQKTDVSGSHHRYSHPLIQKALSIPVHNNDCKLIYKKITAKLIIKNISIFNNEDETI